MSDEKKMILEMLSSGKITADEAKSLLEALEPDSKKSEPAGKREEPASLVGEIVDTIRSGFSNLNFNFEFGDGNRIVLEETHTGQFSAEAVELDLLARNGVIRVETWDEPGFKLDIVKRVKAATREQAEEIVAKYKFAEISSSSVWAGDQECKAAGSKISVSLRLWLPRKHIYSGVVGTKNGGIEVNGIDVGHLGVNAANGSVKVLKVTGRDVTARTVNGSVKIDGGMAKIRAATTNGSISMINFAEDSDVKLETVNGRVKVELPQRSDIGIVVNAATTSGSVRLNHPSLNTLMEERRMTGGRRVEAESRNLDHAAHRIKLYLRSVNGSIQINELE